MQLRLEKRSQPSQLLRVVTPIAAVLLTMVLGAIVFTLLGGDPERTPSLIVGFGVGASFIALFAQLVVQCHSFWFVYYCKDKVF